MGRSGRAQIRSPIHRRSPTGRSRRRCRNSIFWDRKFGAYIAADGDVALTLDHNDYGTLANPDGTTTDLGGNLNQDPRLKGPSASPHLKPTSPLIDAGICAGAPPLDFEGDPRPSGAGCDIGADEYAP